MQSQGDKGHTYIFDSESAAELARLVSQDRLLSKHMGGSLPELASLTGIRRVLDVACGAGGWAIDLAFDNPELEVMGFDISSLMIKYARSLALQLHLDNIEFEVMDALVPLEFPDNSFDLINGRLLFAFMPQGSWPRFLQECRRILRPEGYMRLTETELPFTNSAAFASLIEAGNRGLVRRGLGYSSAGKYLGITPMLGKFLVDAGFGIIRERGIAVNLSWGTEGYPNFYNDHLQVFEQLKAFIKQSAVVQLEEFERWTEQAKSDMESPGFRTILYGLTVLARVP